MVSLLVTRLGKATWGAQTGDEVFDRLLRGGYLAANAALTRADVVRLLDATIDEFRARPTPIGDELWRHIQRCLVEHSLLSWWGRIWGLRFVGRG